MKTKNKFFTLLCLLMGLMVIFTACGKCKEHTDGNFDAKCDSCGADVALPEISYEVSVLDSLGKPMADAIITVYKGEVKQGMNVTGDSGKVTFKLLAGNYSFTVTTAEQTKLVYDEDKCIFTPTLTSVEISLYNSVSEQNAQSLMFEGGGEGKFAYPIAEGGYFTEITSSELTYFIFTPERAGRYKVSFSSDVAAKVGYYGIPMYVRLNDETTSDNRESDSVIYIEISTTSLASGSGVATPYVFGVQGLSESGEGVFSLERVGDHKPTVEEMPWNELVLSKPLEKYVLPDGATVTNVSVTDSSVAVVKGSDGYYHFGSADGPLVLVRITEPTPYLGSGSANVVSTAGSFALMCDNTRFGCYIFDGDGNVVEKKSYHTMMLAYIEACGEKTATDYCGYMPLDDNLKEAITAVGNYLGWWKTDGLNNIFGDDADRVVADNAWLFACCYVNE